MSHVKTARDVSREDACDECTCERLWFRRLTWASSWAFKEKANWGVYLPNDRFRNTCVYASAGCVHQLCIYGGGLISVVVQVHSCNSVCYGTIIKDFKFQMCDT